MTVGMTVAGGPGEVLLRYRIVGPKRRVGVCVQGVDCFPGDELSAPASVMAQIVAMGKAVVIEADEVRNNDPVAEHRDPVKRGRKTRRRA